MKSAIDAGAVLFETDRAARAVAVPASPQWKEIGLLERRCCTRRSENHADIVLAAAIDRLPYRANFLWCHPVLGIEQDDRIDMPGRKRFEQSADIGVLRDDGVHPVAQLPKAALLQIERQSLVAGPG